MNVHSVGFGDSLILVVEGELDLATAAELDDALTRAQAMGLPELVIDLDRVAFVDSTGLYVLIKHVQLARESGQRLLLTRGSLPVRRLFELSGVGDLLPFVDD